MPEHRNFGSVKGGRPAAAVDLEEAARRALDEARRLSRALLVEVGREAGDLARRRIEEAFSLGRKEGWAQGHSEGREAGIEQALTEKRAALDRAAAALVAAARGVVESREAVRAEAEAGVVRLASAIGEKLAARAIETQPDAAREALREALRLVVDRTEVRVRVNPADREAVEDARAHVREEFPEIIRIAVEPDATVSPGGCRVITSSCTVDATLEGRASRIAELLLGERGAA